MSADVIPIILAAGGSTRMGQPKALIELRGESLIRRAQRVAREAGLGRPVVVVGAAAELARAALAGESTEIVENSEWSRGMGSSIRAGVGAAERRGAAALLVLLVDQPGVDAALLAALVSAAGPTGLAVARVASGYAGGVGPPALFGRDWFGELARLPDDAGARRLLERWGDAVVRVSAPQAAYDLDTPEQLERWRSERH